MAAVKIGTQFRATYADGNCLWKVIQKLGRGVWLCEIDKDDMDWAGTQKSFMTREIEQRADWDKVLNSLSSEHDKFYASLVPGWFVHYKNGFDQFVRCEVVSIEGKNVLKPIALVGKWDNLPKRDRWGKIYNGYHADMVIKGEVFQPNCSNIFEKDCKGTDPTRLPAIDLSVPDMTVEEQKSARSWQLLQEICDVANNATDPDVALKKIFMMV